LPEFRRRYGYFVVPGFWDYLYIPLKGEGSKRNKQCKCVYHLIVSGFKHYQLNHSAWIYQPVFWPLCYAIKTVQYGMAVAMELPLKEIPHTFTLF
jgi:hypothetical protein